MENLGFLLKAVSFSWKNYVVYDRKFKKDNEIYWICEIKRNGFLYFSRIEKGDFDKSLETLRKELFKYLGYKKYDGAFIYGRKN